ncbi:MAG: hypothetical protein KatS3mg090_0668 [Patescibacteria group bacterium]|nr:MAG: hypothetical protein KatS3mg090_0668 [Patescibacteria group bacterium]
MKFSNSVYLELNYWRFFEYFPTTVELWLVMPFEISFKQFMSRLEKLKGIEILKIGNEDRVVIKRYKDKIRSFLNRREIFRKKINNPRLKVFLMLAKKIGFTSLIGLSGSLAYGVAKTSDDFDLFVITQKNRLWISRFVLNILAVLLFLKRKTNVKKAKDKVCLNLFFDFSSLKISKIKQTEYVAREIISLRVYYDNNNTWLSFINQNRWIYSFFPNFKNHLDFAYDLDFSFKTNRTVFDFFIDYLNIFLGKLQLIKIKHNKIKNEKIFKSQLWFHPNDFEKFYEKLRLKALYMSENNL